MMIDGDSFGKRTGSYCYIPVFHSNLATKDHWYVGSLFMTQYVVVYDNTPYQKRGESKAQMGFGKMDPTKVRYEIDSQYLNSSSHFAPTPAFAEKDASHKITHQAPSPDPPGPDPTPTPGPGPKPNPEPEPDNNKQKMTFIYIGAGVGVLIIICIIVTCCVSRKKKSPHFRMFSDADGLKGVIQ